MVVALAAVGGCASPPPVTQNPLANALTTRPTTSPLDDRVVARVSGMTISAGQLEKPLIESYGLNVLLNMVQLEVVKQQAATAKVSVTPAEIAKERQMTLDKMFKDAPK